MTRGFSTQPVDSKLISQIVDLASRAPSAGKTQGWHALVITASDTAKFWDDTLAVEKRESFRWRKLLDAPVIALVFADPLAYVERYSENDKAHTGLGIPELMSDCAPMMLRVRPPQLTTTVVSGERTNSGMRYGSSALGQS